ncbi:FAD binding domain-containing protein [Amycolatopsis pithecellobii]|uniref:Carbon monoxide dehydrogenase n=1 Tax=Amycolatopsis pithecellobii TaxID=664692 RepID=A0A6N7YNW5_9PSEU|nr:FAD binding domain-containing protein [Amycolatopsis pithecellobii]MTD54697.1 carbon monoxide dehydrogenase [Amycolatopsis pithecellobii]
MIRTRLRYHRPRSLTETSEILLAHHGNVAVLGGGTQLLPRMGRHVTEVENVVDLKDLGLAGIGTVGGAIEIGARVTYADVLDSALLRAQLPLLPRMAQGVTGGRQLTQQATLVGAACFAFPSADARGALAALGAVVEIHGPDGLRSVPLTAFLVDAFAVDLRAGEFVRAMRMTPQRTGGYCKVKHSTGSWPIVTASAVRDDARGVRVTLGAVQAVPVIVQLDDPHDPAELKMRVDAAITAPWSDVLAPGEYRAAIAAAVARRAVNELLGV